ncbi:MAG: HAMP domain-containing sensor histidine kinase [Jiangellaceae bacterium]
MESVNHHLRTPLTMVVGHAELLVDEGAELPPEVQQSLAAMLRAARRINDVIHGVCDLVAIACVDPETVDSVDITDVVTEEVDACRGRAAQRGVRLVITGDKTATCTTDARRLRRALRELLDNAVTYAQDESTVRVSWTTLATRIRIEVSDRGDGIDSVELERLTRPFERGTHPRQPATGQGMGLAVASGIAASLGGRLLLSEGPGPGLQACIELPVDAMHRYSATVTDVTNDLRQS